MPCWQREVGVASLSSLAPGYLTQPAIVILSFVSLFTPLTPSLVSSSKIFSLASASQANLSHVLPSVSAPILQQPFVVGPRILANSCKVGGPDCPRNSHGMEWTVILEYCTDWPWATTAIQWKFSAKLWKIKPLWDMHKSRGKLVAANVQHVYSHVAESTNHNKPACQVAVLGPKYNGKTNDLAIMWGKEYGLTNSWKSILYVSSFGVTPRKGSTWEIL